MTSEEKTAQNKIDRLVIGLENMMMKYFIVQRNAILNQIDGGGDLFDVITSAENARRLERLLNLFLNKAYSIGYNLVLKAKVSKDFNTRAKKINDHTEESLRSYLKKSKLLVRDAVKKFFELTARSRATSIGITEINMAFNNGINQAGNDADQIVKSKSGRRLKLPSEGDGKTIYKQWRAQIDTRVRDSHADAHGQTVAMNEDFEVGSSSLSYPGDPSGPPEEIINCRCYERILVAP